MHSVEYEKSNWDMYRATFPINGREIVVSKYIFGFGIVIIASILVFAGSMICQKMIVGRINIYFISRVVKAIWINGTLDMIFAFPILCRYGYDEGRLSAAMIVCFLECFIHIAATIVIKSAIPDHCISDFAIYHLVFFRCIELQIIREAE